MLQEQGKTTATCQPMRGIVGRLSPWQEHMPDLSTHIRTTSCTVFADGLEKCETKHRVIETVKAKENKEKQSLQEASCCPAKGLGDKKVGHKDRESWAWIPKIPPFNPVSSKSLSVKSTTGPQRQLQSFNIFQSVEVMLRNLPNNYTRSMLLNLLEKQGFVGRFDFLYLVLQWSVHICCAFACGNCTFLNKLLYPIDSKDL